jgi:hypothetical protein
LARRPFFDTFSSALQASAGQFAPADQTGRGDRARFRRELYASLTARADALFELTDALLCADGPITPLVKLTLVR